MEKTRQILFYLLIVSAAALSAETAKESPTQLFQQALYEEQTTGDLDKAIELYQKVLDEAAEVEKLAARATYQLGMCYLKKDDKAKAAEYFNQVVSKYSSQTSLAQKAAVQLRKIRPQTTGSTPVVINTVPANYADDVSPELGQISVTFDQPMTDRSWSWCRWNYPYPETTGDPYYNAAKTTCTLPVKLEPGKAYFVRINSEPYMNFRSVQGVSAQPYVLVFAAKNQNGNASPIPKDMLAKAKEINAISPARPYTQEMHSVIDPNGVIHFKSPQRITNDGSEPIEDTGFISSDFVHLETMFDDKDRPIAFTAAHEGNIYRYHPTFNEPILPGETMVYTTEGTITGLIKPVTAAKDTLQYYMKHSPATNEPTLRIETYLLPEGAEIVSTTPPDMQRTEKKGQIELYVEEMIPPGGSITTAFQYKLTGANPASAEPLKLTSAPWADGEVMELRLKKPAGNEYGTIIYSAQSDVLDGKDTWQIISHLYATEGSVSQYTFVEAQAESFAPIYGQTTNWMGNFVAEYNEGNVKLTTGSNDKKNTRDIPVGGVVYDNEQAVYLIRRMPLAENYQGSFPIFTVQAGATVECRIKVLGVEDITVAAGTFKCFKTDLSIYADGVKSLQHTLWFSADEHKYLVKYDVGGAATMELAKVWQRDKKTPMVFENAEPAFSVAVPADWRFYSYQSPGPQYLLQMLPPDVKAWALLARQKHGDDPDSASATTISKADSEKLKGFFKNYLIRPDSSKDITINGCQAAQYIADYQQSGNGLQTYDKPKDMVEYRTYIVDKAEVYWFVFRIEKDKFEENKPEFDSIVNSFKINANQI